MNITLPDPSIILFLGLGFILLVLCGIITWTIRISFRLGRVEPPKLKFLFAIAFLQILLGVLTVLAVRAIRNDPVIAIGTGVGMIFLSGLILLKLILKDGWKRSLRLWAIAVAIQLVLVPVCSVIMLAVWGLILYWLYPPQF